MKMKYFLIIYMLLAGILSVAASPLDEAVAAYDNGDYAHSIDLYDTVIKEKGESAPLLYNLGNAYVKAGDYGNAMLCYKRALNLDPSDKELKENIAYLASKVTDNNKAEAKGKKISVVRADKPFFSDVRNYIVYSHLPDTWALWAGISFLLASICFAVYIFTTVVILRKIGFFGGFIALGVSFITLCFALVSVSDRRNPKEGVVTAYKVNLLTEPDKGAKSNPISLTRGTVLDINDEDIEEGSKEKWYKVKLNSDFSGWIKASDFEII